MTLTVHAVPAFKDNYIWLIANRAAVVVDPGDATPVLEFLLRWNISLAAILITHHHHDHIDGIAELQQHYRAPSYGPGDEFIPHLTHPVTEGERISLAPDLGEWVIMRVPGHTRGHVAYYGAGLLFCGDTLFGGGCGRIFDGSADQLHASLNKIATLPTTTRVYCAHEYTVGNLIFGQCVEPGNRELVQRLETARALRTAGLPTVPSTVGLELATNVFLRCHIPDVHRAVEAHVGRLLASENDVFTALRHWKDQFRITA